MQISLVRNEDGSKNLTVFHKGQTYLAHSTHPNYAAIEVGALADDESVIELFDVAQTAADKLEPLSERISHANGRLYLDGVEVHDALADQIVAFLRQGVGDWKPLVKFFENVLANPNEHSREQLYRWLQALGSETGLTITDDGLIVGYKGVQNQGDGFVSINSGTAFVNGEKKSNQRIKQNVGDVVTMPRDEVTHDPSLGCHQGLHVGTYDYASGFGRGAVLEVHVNPRDVVSVPTDSGDQKMRTCRYVVVGTIETPYSEAVLVDRADALGECYPCLDGTCDCDEPEAGWDDCGCGEPDCCGDPGCCCDAEPEDADLDMPDDEDVFGTLEGEGGLTQDQLRDATKAIETRLNNLGDPEPRVLGKAELIDLFLDSGETHVKDGVAVGDEFEAVDSRRSGTTFKVESIEGDFAVGKSLPRNLTRKVRLDRLTSRKYRKV